MGVWELALRLCYLVLVSNDSIRRPSQRICKPWIDNFSPRIKDIVSYTLKMPSLAFLLQIINPSATDSNAQV